MTTISKNKTAKMILFAGLLLACLYLPGKGAAAAERFQTVSAASEGCTLVMVEGAYNADTQAAIDRINEIRLEACREGIEDPRYSGRALTEADYVPIQWSSALEYIARVRAAEASLVVSHTRPNGGSCFTVKAPDGSSSYGEVLAWNSSSTMVSGVDQWYGEKYDWVNHTGRETGHYLAMINPSNTYVGLASFNYEDGVWYNTVSGEFRGGSGYHSQRSPAVADCQVIIEIAQGALSGAALRTVAKDVQYSGALDKGDRLQYALGIRTVLEGWQAYVRDIGSVQWNSSNPSVAQVSSDGTVAITGVGSAAITGTSSSGRSASQTLTPAHTPSGWTLKKKASFTEDGLEQKVCEVCGDVVESQKIAHLASIELEKNEYEYTGSECRPGVTVKDADGNIVNSSGYTVARSNNTNAGTAAVTVTGAGNYEGSKSVSFTIRPVSLAGAKMDSIWSQTYTGSEITPKPSVAYGWSYLNEGTDFTFSYKNNKEVGTASITASGKGNYTGTLSGTFAIEGIPLSNGYLDSIPSQTYTGSAVEPKTVVHVGGKLLTAGTDYKVTYRDNVQTGTASVTVTGCGHYAGTLTGSFTIKPKSGTGSTGITGSTGTTGGTGSTSSLAKGIKLQDFWNNQIYTVTKKGTSGKAEVTFSGTFYSADKISVPATISYNGIVYKVTSVAAKAFRNNRYLKTVTLGKNITSIGSEAFAGCTSLKKIVIPAKVKKIGKKAFYGDRKLKTIQIKTKKLNASRIGSGAFKGIYKKAVFKLPSSKRKTYQKILLKKGAKKTMKFK